MASASSTTDGVADEQPTPLGEAFTFVVGATGGRSVGAHRHSAGGDGRPR